MNNTERKQLAKHWLHCAVKMYELSARALISGIRYKWSFMLRASQRDFRIATRNLFYYLTDAVWSQWVFIISIIIIFWCWYASS